MCGQQTGLDGCPERVFGLWISLIPESQTFGGNRRATVLDLSCRSSDPSCRRRGALKRFQSDRESTESNAMITAEIVIQALQTGCRHIDTAQGYGTKADPRPLHSTLIPARNDGLHDRP
jgi:hypothetical protein